MIREIIENSMFVISEDNIIRLGYQNGWNQKNIELYKELKQFEMPGSAKSMNIGRCVTSYHFDIEDNGEIFKVVSVVDSSD